MSCLALSTFLKNSTDSRTFEAPRSRREKKLFKSFTPQTTTMDYSLLLPPSWEQKIDEWLHEDIPSFDYGGFVVGDKQETAILYCKAQGVLAGVPFVNKIFARLDCTVEWHYKEGTKLDGSKSRVEVATVKGTARNILMGERTALNLIARASGIATKARAARDIGDAQQFKGCIAGTRKTTPGFRLVEKYALLVGGCDQHRYDLSSMIMLKDNHIWSAGNITEAVKRAKSVGGFALKVEVECQSESEAEEAIKAGAEIVMLDNFEPKNLHAAAANLKAKYQHVIIEGSGGINLDTLASYCSPHVDVLSMGGLTQGVQHIDFSLKIKPAK